jgi:hypothetical protein
VITPELSARLSADGLSCVLRADAIRRDTLLAMAATWNEDGGKYDLIDALDRLAAVVAGDPTEGELDAALDAVEDACGGMDAAEVHIDRRAAASLRRGLGAVVARLSGRLVNTVSVQRVRRSA